MIGDSQHRCCYLLLGPNNLTWSEVKKCILLWLSTESDLGLVRNDYVKVNRVQRHLVIYC